MARITIYANHIQNEISPFLLGHFVEQFRGNIPDGIYMPDNALSDEDGMRTDVLEKMREAGVTQIRWAGNFSSAYHWEDGVGEKAGRPKKISFAWEDVEDNGHGTAEFIRLCKKVGAEPVIGVNMGSGTPEEAMNWVEYCNGTEDTYYANLRRSHGYADPFNVKYWCLGNEMYAQWQFGALNAQEYAKKAIHFAYAMRRADPTIKLTAVGLETDPAWNYEVVEKLSVLPVPYAKLAGNYIDYLSAHYYPIGNESAYADADYRTRMTLGEFFHERTMLMRNAIENATDDSESGIKIVWDEWNPMGERDGSEFTLEMALWSSTIMNSFIRDSKYVEMANYTFFVGGNGPIQVTEKGLTVQPEFYLMKLYADHMGQFLLETRDDAEKVCIDMPVDRRWPKYGRACRKTREVSLLDIAATAGQGKITVFVTNRSFDQDIETTLVLAECDKLYRKVVVSTLWHERLDACNTDNPDEVKTAVKEECCENNSYTAVFLRHSINAVTFFMAGD